MALPDAVQYGQVKWRVVSAVADAADVDALPDAVPVTGTVTFSPSATVLLATAGTPVTVIGTAVTYNLDTEGVLRDAQARDLISLVATDSAGITPTGWTWEVSYRLNGGLSRGSFSFALPAGSVVDLTSVAPVSSSNGVPIIQGPAGGTMTQAEIIDLIEANPPIIADASATAKGVVELATTAEATTGTDTVRAVTPAGLKAVADTKLNIADINETVTAADIPFVPAGTIAATNVQAAIEEVRTESAAASSTPTATAARVYVVGNKTLTANGSEYDVDFGATAYSHGGTVISGNFNEIQVPTKGIYLWTISGLMFSTAAGPRRLIAMVNSTPVGQVGDVALANAEESYGGSLPLVLNAGEWVGARVFVGGVGGGTGTVTLYGGNALHTWMSLVLLSTLP